mmetsp:Transcript_177844/g.570400  ORF Transcript_177844/g.570400 Transcript_177844/m.570400 type:complete len:502 (+) Transcript_177844:93-1598(+)|eukprot:CAMPEP_0203889158 /NCGR_PEP_ID=MMETSP0359-20131031/32718_1 /ASSEMBLY_ACC=CAM_ASM_000338 /TAXON_ID=268821 /ORGANISM="Scrippsiella Hangoei, Strain SHTV-5" /LENGTH=501 /DNA_ID=CAMNT_0050810497 /DNA_START=73 /DNA_END=1578 /DNA_ORIENTATION=-
MLEGGEEDEFIVGAWPIGLAWLAFVLISVSTAWNVYRHLLCYSRPDLQQHVLRILLVAPIYAMSAALGLSISESGAFLVRSVRDIWEAVVIYSFLNLIIEYMGGEHHCLQSISQREEDVPHLFPFNYCLKPIPVGKMIRFCKMSALQFVIVKPVVAVLSIVVYLCGQFHDWYYQWLLFVVYNISYSLALYGLYLIYFASHAHPSLQSKRPLLKFVSVKMIVFLTFWQSLLLPHAPLPGSVSRWEDFILSIEMVVFGALMNGAFSWREFHSGFRGSKKALQFDITDAIELDVATSGQPGATGQPTANSFGRGCAVQNAANAFCPRDVVTEASHNFSRRYQQHVLIECAQEYELRDAEAASGPGSSSTSPATAEKGDGKGRTFRAKTYLIGQSLAGSAGAGVAVTASNTSRVGRAGAASGDAAVARNVAAALAEGSPSAAFASPLASPAFKVKGMPPLPFESTSGVAVDIEQGAMQDRPLEEAPPLHLGFEEPTLASAGNPFA